MNCSNCDTTKFTFSGAIAPLFDLNCSGCHDHINYSTYGGNINLETYPDIHAYFDPVYNQVKFLDAINYTSADTNMRMPRYGKLSDCQLKQIQQWFDGGYPNN